ncbi:MAG: HEAT repeat domain-containing protein [Candidatus Zixiibacteriota bacterium]
MRLIVRAFWVVCLFSIIFNIVSAGEIERKVDSLFIIASSGELKYRDSIEPAIESLAALGSEAVPRLLEKYDTKDARERHTINDILVKIGKPATPFLLAGLSDPNDEKVSRLCYTLGNIKDSAAVEGIIAVALADDWQVRSNAAGALGMIGHNLANETIVKLLSDPDETVRKSAIVSAGKLLIENAIPILIHMLGDDFYGARMTASEALTKFDALSVISQIADSLSSDNELAGNLGCSTLGLIGGDSAAVVIATQLTSPTPLRRALAVEAIYYANSSLGCAAVENIKDSETDETVLFFIKQVLSKYAAR